MPAAPRLQPGRTGGYARILEHCAAVARVTGDAPGTARLRLETSLGPELAGRLVGALAADRRRSAGP